MSNHKLKSKKSSKKAGRPPGTLEYVGKERLEPVKTSIFNYSEDHFEEKPELALEKVLLYKEEKGTTWIDFIGIHDVISVQQVCQHFNIHPLTIEDIISTEQRPKLEENEDYIYVVVKMLEYDIATGRIMVEQVSLLLGHNYVISFQEKEGDTFEAVRSRLRAGKGRIRNNGSDYLFYALLDTIVDNYFLILEKFADNLEEIEVEILENPTHSSLASLYNLKRETVILRRSVWPVREVVHMLEREDLILIKKETRIYLRDVYDHTIRIIETIENFRDVLSGMVDLYQSTISNRLNMVMKVLTIISTIFIPLTFIVGVYGMNFVHMPELEWKFGYLGVWVIMIAVLFGMIYFFKKKKWF